MVNQNDRGVAPMQMHPSKSSLTAKIEPFDSFWEAPTDIEKGYRTYTQFYRHNYLKYFPKDKDINILAISCGFGYLVHMLNHAGYNNVIGIDSFAEKIEYAKKKNLNCIHAEAFTFLRDKTEEYDVIFCEQELNHLTKDEILEFLAMCRASLKHNGLLMVHVLNGANPITGAEALAQNFDHYNTFTEYTLHQVMEYSEFKDVKVLPLNLYVFWKNPANYVLIFISSLYTLFFRFSFMMYGKSNKLFTKKIAAIARKQANALSS
jgi:2-polyprenyl-3-methyl-5-hydroxy-6-metoxy-1,4-benzoquinol methylase